MSINIPADTYYSDNSNVLNDWNGMTILVLQGVQVDKKEYQSLAHQLTKKGFKVIVPNFFRPTSNYLCPDYDSVANFLAFQEKLTSGFLESLEEGLILLSHSAGGVAAFQSLNITSPTLKIFPSAIITYGSSVPRLFELQCKLPPVLMISGVQDNVINTNFTKWGFNTLPKIHNNNYFLLLSDFDHYSITNSGTPKQHFNSTLNSSLYGLEANTIIAEIVNQFILGCLNDYPWQDNLNLNLIAEIKRQ